MNDPQNKRGLWFRGRLQAFGYAFRGIKALIASECHARFHLAAAAVAVALGFWLRISAVEWCCIIFAIAGVLVSEALNTALEFLADKVSPERHPLIGKAKDIGAAAVLIAAIAAALVGVIIFGPKLWHMIF